MFIKKTQKTYKKNTTKTKQLYKTHNIKQNKKHSQLQTKKIYKKLIYENQQSNTNKKTT